MAHPRAMAYVRRVVAQSVTRAVSYVATLSAALISPVGRWAVLAAASNCPGSRRRGSCEGLFTIGLGGEFVSAHLASCREALPRIRFRVTGLFCFRKAELAGCQRIRALASGPMLTLLPLILNAACRDEAASTGPTTIATPRENITLLPRKGDAMSTPHRAKVSVAPTVSGLDWHGNRRRSGRLTSITLVDFIATTPDPLAPEFAPLKGKRKAALILRNALQQHGALVAEVEITRYSPPLRWGNAETYIDRVELPAKQGEVFVALIINLDRSASGHLGAQLSPSLLIAGDPDLLGARAVEIIGLPVAADKNLDAVFSSMLDQYEVVFTEIIRLQHPRSD